MLLWPGPNWKIHNIVNVIWPGSRLWGEMKTTRRFPSQFHTQHIVYVAISISSFLHTLQINVIFLLYRQTREHIDISFSSYVNTSRSHTTVSHKEGLIKMRVAKHHLWNTGIYLLPRCKFIPSTLSPTTATTLSSYVDKPKLLLAEMFTGPDAKLKQKEIQTNLSPFYGLRETLQIMWLDCIDNPEVTRLTLKQINNIPIQSKNLLCF